MSSAPHHKSLNYLLFVALACVFAMMSALAGCEAQDPQGAEQAPAIGQVEFAEHGDRGYVGLTVLDGQAEVNAALASGSMSLRAEDDAPFLRAAMRWDMQDESGELLYRVRRGAGWSGWEPIPVIWNESVAFNGVIELSTPADELQIKTANAGSQLTFFLAELYDAPLQRELAATEVEPEGSADDRYRTIEQGLAPPSFVNLRSAWGARSTGNCGSSHDPSFLTIHHTVSPTNDSLSAEARMRQIQNYHIDGNGWCDIGYHFVVSADGRIWQGRASHDRTGAHVGGHNTNNVGISFMGSFHIDQVPQPMIDDTAPLLAWFRDNYSITLNRTQVKGHREWSGQSTSCPGQFLLPRIDEMIDIAENGGKDETVDVNVTWATIPGQARNFVDGGSSASIFDALPGQTVEGRITVRNGPDRPATDNVRLGYWIQDPYLEPISYQIQTDRPSKDGQTFVASSFTSPDNPPAGAPPAEGFIQVGSLEPGESVRLVFQLNASQYSIGAVDHPDLRGWVKHIGGYYGEQDGWDDTVETNNAGRLLRDYAELDVFSPMEWQFNGGDGEDVEGWTGNNTISDLAVNTADDALAARAASDDPRVQSPQWTSIDADTMKTIVVRARQHGEAREAQIFWIRESEGYAEERSVRFTHPGGGAWETFELDMSGDPDWSGEVIRLRLDPWNGGPFEGAPAWFDLDYLTVAAGDVPLDDMDQDGALSDVDCDDTDPDRYPGATEICDQKDNDCNGEVDEDACGGDTDPNGDMFTDPDGSIADPSLPGDAGTDGGTDQNDAKTSDSCGCTIRTESQLPPASLPILLALGLLGLVWRRTGQSRRT